ncbi:WAP four-disulfide core domain protein 1-like [Ciona intestinalis]
MSVIFLTLFYSSTASLVFSLPLSHLQNERLEPSLRYRHHRRLKIPQTVRPVATECQPSSPGHIPNDACAALPCSFHNECEGAGTRCCFNGCIYSCIVASDPSPPLIDWMTVHTRERDNSVINLEDVDYEIQTGEDLIESHNNQEMLGEICSTTIDEEGNPPLDCPHGYICHVENGGHPDRGVPDSGRCMAIDLNENT